MESVDIVYGWLALIPPVLAIALAVWKKRVIPALFLGIWAGAVIVGAATAPAGGYWESLGRLLAWDTVKGLLDTFSTYLVTKSLADSWNIGIIVFCLAIGGMIGVISKMGGTQAIAAAIVKRARTVRSTQLAAALMGVAIFFDDYANSMIVGNTMRPVTDKQKISREKLAYIVDSTAAPVSSMAPVSTWIAMELGLIAAALKELQIEGNSLMVFFASIPFRFYSLFALVLVFALIIMRRDFGPMRKAEKRARTTGKVFASDASPMVTDDPAVLPAEGVSGTIWHAIIPIGLFLCITVGGMWYNGYEKGRAIRDCFGAADASVVLTWAAFLGSLAAIGAAIGTGKLDLKQSMEAWISGCKTMVVAVMILALAFALKAVITDMHLAKWLAASTEGWLSGKLIPLLTFILAMLIAFATGTSWGTNSILMPIVIPIAAQISGGGPEVTPLMTAAIGAVLTGAVFGDHCSPISDTTILSSMASGSDHIDHVRTQIPYAVTAAAFAAIFGFLPAGFGCPVWISLLMGITAVIVFARFVGKRVPEEAGVDKKESDLIPDN